MEPFAGNQLNKKITILTFCEEMMDVNLFFETNHLLIKKFIKNPESILNAEKKINLEEANDKLKDSQDKFINWLMSN